jgi:hypothetical protein
MFLDDSHFLGHRSCIHSASSDKPYEALYFLWSIMGILPPSKVCDTESEHFDSPEFCAKVEPFSDSFYVATRVEVL